MIRSLIHSRSPVRRLGQYSLSLVRPFNRTLRSIKGIRYTYTRFIFIKKFPVLQSDIKEERMENFMKELAYLYDQPFYN